LAAPHDETDDLRPLVLGRGRFVDDLAPPRCLHAHFVRSPFARARIAGIDTAAARGVDGVVDVLTGRDLADATAPIEARMDERMDRIEADIRELRSLHLQSALRAAERISKAPNDAGRPESR